ncbi:Zinc metalloproteinase nas-30 [Clarias magur]|uniref:Zinc metalloproteinase nas-30 n=1 Tax=Clarias magur TaxID=1594786 RepID=A0A8J4X691_CLAMG|nr:Zinc metalloproteinase nas-30 [Clarias magur]
MSGAHLRTPDAPPGFIMPAEMVSAQQRWRHKASRMRPLETEVQTSPAPQSNGIIREKIPTGPKPTTIHLLMWPVGCQEVPAAFTHKVAR